MLAIPINWWAVIMATIVSVVLGTIWYGPLFGTAWMKTIGIAKPDRITPEIKKMMMKSYIFVVIGSLLMNFVLLHVIVFGSAYMHNAGLAAGFQAAIWSWLGFIAPVTIGSVIWETRPWKYWFITAGYYLVLLLINGAILSVWM